MSPRMATRHAESVRHVGRFGIGEIAGPPIFAVPRRSGSTLGHIAAAASRLFLFRADVSSRYGYPCLL